MRATYEYDQLRCYNDSAYPLYKQWRNDFICLFKIFAIKSYVYMAMISQTQKKAEVYYMRNKRILQTNF